RQAALQGQVHNPTVSFAPIDATGRSYPYDPVWTNFAPRVAAAWNPSFGGGWRARGLGDKKTVIRGGYGRVYDRINGVQLVIDPQQGLGFSQNLQCLGPSNAGQCLGNAGTDPRMAFRPGVDAGSIPLPAVPPKVAAPLIPGVTGFPGA